VFGRSWRIGSIGGIAIRVDSSWALIAILIVYSLWVRFSQGYDDLEGASAFGLAVFAAALFFGSVLVHELAHAAMARLQGIRVFGITLFLFGGATSARVEERGPGAEFLVTVVGPGSSLVLSAIFWGLSESTNTGTALHDAFRDLAGINFALAIFNVVPGFPLDGGRMLRSIVWKATGSLERATRVAAAAGQVVGVLLIASGIVQAARDEIFSALWLAMIGWFLLQAARGAVRQVRIRQALGEGVVAEAMRAPPPAIPADISLSEALDRYLRDHEEEGFPVLDRDRLVGLLTFDGAARVGRNDPLRQVREAMMPMSEIAIVAAEDGLDQVAEQLSEGGGALVVSDGRLVGVISGVDLSRWLGAHRP
jgi:Zn-dependent protease